MINVEDIKKYGSISIVILSMLAIFMSGIFFSIFYLAMSEAEDGFLAQDCTIYNNVYVDSCQDLWELSVYPFFALKELLIWFSYFFIFALVIGMLIMGYQSGKSPVLLGAMILFVSVLTYLGIEFANVYRKMLEVPAFLSMIQPFTIYNRIMLSFPWFIFIVGLFSVVLGIVNFQRSNVNKITTESLNY